MPTPTINYTDIATRNPNPLDGQKELERIVGGVPTKDQSANLIQAYVNIANTRAAGGGGGFGGKTVNIDTILEARVGKSKVTDVGAGDAIDALKFLSPQVDLAQKNQMIQGEILNQLKRESDLHTTIAEKVGVAGDLLNQYKNMIAESQINGLKFGYTMEQVSGMVGDMSEKTGKFNIISEQTLNRSYETGRAFVGTLYKLGEAFTEFEKVGIGAKNALDSIDKAGRSSMSLGLNAKKTTEMLKNELGKLNEYGFANGVDGLNRMVQRSLEFRMNMSEVFKIADKVMDPDKAIELTANMQMLGGAIGDLNDPLKLMYMATNNVEGLQDAMMGAVENLATYNEEQQRFEVTGINLRRVREMANALGVDYKELTKGAIAAQERLAATNDLLAKGFDISDADREFIVNMSQMKDGKMTITLPKNVADELGMSTQVAVESLTQKQIEQLKGYQDQLAEMSTEDIAKGSYNALTQIEKNTQSLLQGGVRNLMRKTVGEGGAADIAYYEDGDKTKPRGLARAEESLDILTKKQALGEKGLLGNTLESIFGKIETVITNADIVNKLESALDGFFNELNESAKRSSDKLIEEEKRRNDINKDSKPMTFNFKHDFNLVPRFEVPFNLEYKGSKEEYV